MTISTLPLSYCTNVHPGRTAAEVEDGLQRFAVPIKVNYGSELAAGLWLSAAVVREFSETVDGIQKFADRLAARGLCCYTLNAFPYGDFHSARVKENVYLPDWTEPTRFKYTVRCARLLASLLPSGCDGSISTVPLGFKPFNYPDNFTDRCADQLILLARELGHLHDETGRVVRLAIEPEPFCVIETTVETLRFFRRLRERAADAGALDVVSRHLGVCFDVCHQAVEFENVVESIRSLAAADIRINKVHITCAIQVAQPGSQPDALAALSRYVEPRYLHQTFARKANSEIIRQVDLDEQLTSLPRQDFYDSEQWRVHFHVPVDAERLGPLGTTRAELKRALSVIPDLDYAPHLEVETYTWEVLPGGANPNIIDGLTRELLATKALLDH